MANKGGWLHEVTHRIPGVPAHIERRAGHQGTTVHGHNHSPARPPRFLPAWQRRIARLFGQEV